MSRQQWSLGMGEGEGVDVDAFAVGGGEGEGEGVDALAGGRGEGEDLSSSLELEPVPEESTSTISPTKQMRNIRYQQGASLFRLEVSRLARRVLVGFDRLLVKGGPTPKAFKSLASQASRINAMVFLQDCRDADEGRADVLTYAGLVENARKAAGSAEAAKGMAAAEPEPKVHLKVISPQVVRPFTLRDIDESQSTQSKIWYEETTKVLQHLKNDRDELGEYGLSPLLTGDEGSKQQRDILDLIERLKEKWPKKLAEAETIDMDGAVRVDVLDSMIDLFTKIEALRASQERPYQEWANLKRLEWEEGSCVQHGLVSEFVVAEPGLDATKRLDYELKRHELEKILRNEGTSEQKEYFSILLQCAQDIVKKQKIKTSSPHHFSLVMLNCAYVHRMVAIMLQWDGAVIYPYACGELRRAYDYAFRFCSLREPQRTIDKFPDYISALIGVPTGRAVIIANELSKEHGMRFSKDSGLHAVVPDPMPPIRSIALTSPKGRILPKEWKLLASLTDFQIESARYVRISGVIDTQKPMKLLDERGVSSEVRRMARMFDETSRRTCASPAVNSDPIQQRLMTDHPVFMPKAVDSPVVASKIIRDFHKRVTEMGTSIEICRAEHLRPLFSSAAFLECGQSSLLISIDNQNFNVWTPERKNYFATLCSAAKLIKETNATKKIVVIVTAGLQKHKLFPEDLIPMDTHPGDEIMLQGGMGLTRLQAPGFILRRLREQIRLVENDEFRQLGDESKSLETFNAIMSKVTSSLLSVFEYLRYISIGKGEVDLDRAVEHMGEMLTHQQCVSARVNAWSEYERNWIRQSRVNTQLRKYFSIKTWERLDLSNRDKFDSLLFGTFESFRALYSHGHCPFVSRREFDIERQRYASALITSAEEYFERAKKNSPAFSLLSEEDKHILFYANCVYLHEEVSVLSAVKGAIAYPSPSAALTYAIRFSQLRPKQDMQLTGASYLRLLLQIDHKRADALLSMLANKYKIRMTVDKAGTPLCDQEIKKDDDFVAVRETLRGHSKLAALAKEKKQIKGGGYPSDIQGLLNDAVPPESVVKRGVFFTNFSHSVRDLKASEEVEGLLGEFCRLESIWESRRKLRGNFTTSSPDLSSSSEVLDEARSESVSPSDIPAGFPGSNSPGFT